ncbi:MAG: 3-isopropylmalate dehydratase small subunit [Actinomycetota bacterium]
MEPVRRVSGTGVPLKRSDVDTDQIIPAAWLKRIERTGFGSGLFSAWMEDPEFVLNQPRYRGGSILLTGPNFGCGSSREHAVWALEESGFYAVISASFADIFRANALKNGLLAVELPQPVVTAIVEAVEEDPRTEITVDVEHRKVFVPSIGVEEDFELDDFARYRLLNGLDDIGLTLQKQDEISQFEAQRPSFKPAVSDGS